MKQTNPPRPAEAAASDADSDAVGASDAPVPAGHVRRDAPGALDADDDGSRAAAETNAWDNESDDSECEYESDG